MLQVENLTRNTTLIRRGRVADNSWTRLKGLIGVRHLAEGDGLLISPCKGVHCMFMSIPIDVIHVDQADRVVALTQGMKPWALGRLYRSCRYVLEVPVGSITRTATTIGDQLRITRGTRVSPGV